MNLDNICNDDIVKLNDSAKTLLEISEKILQSRRSRLLQGLYSETKLEDETQLCKQDPENYYYFRSLNVCIYIHKIKSSGTFTVSCENWQYKPLKQFKEVRVYRGVKSYGAKETLDEAIELFYQIINFYLSDNFKTAIQEDIF